MPDVSTRPLADVTSPPHPPGKGAGPLVSVVIPVYNRVGLLRHTIRSVRAQSLADWELILVDDGSTEDVAAVASSFGDSRIRTLRQENLGSAAARNRGLAAARGELLACLDSDDLWHPELLAASVAALRDHPADDASYALVEAVDGEGRPLAFDVQPEPRSGVLLDDLLDGRPLFPSSVIFRRECLRRWGGYQEGMDDWEMWIRWSLGGCRFRCVPRTLVQYRIHGDNEHLNWPARYAMHLKMAESVFDRPEMPGRLRERRPSVLAKQHASFGLLAWQLGREGEGSQAFAVAVREDRRIAWDDEVYYALACAHQGRAIMAPRKPFRCDQARRTIDACRAEMLAGAEARPLSGREQRRARAASELALARASYVRSPDDVDCARGALWRSFRAQPMAMLRPSTARWALRVAIGRRGVGRLRGARIPR